MPTSPADDLRPGVPYLELVRPGRPDKRGKPVRARDTVLVGKHPDADVVLSDRPDVSQKHALFARTGPVWQVFDLNTRSGTVVNGEVVLAGRARVRSGSTVVIGQEQFTARVLLGDAEKPYPGDFDYYELPKFLLVRPLHKSDAKGDVVYLGYGTTTRAPRAVRVFAPSAVNDPKWLKKFVRGLKAAKSVAHPHVLPIHFAGSIRWAGTVTPTWYLVTEYMPGGSLREVIRKGAKLSAKRVVRFGRDIGAALSAAADARILHRSINPGCILFAADGSAKLGDFSLMREDVLTSYQQVTTQNFVAVDQEYRPPEALRGDGHLDLSADLYSLAACMYEALAGSLPFRQKNLTDTLAAVREDVPRPLSEVVPGTPAALSDAVSKALEKEPTDRFRTPRDFLRALPAE